MIKKSFSLLIFKILNSFKKEFFFLFAILLFETVILAANVLTIVPFADYLFDNTLSNPSKITVFTIRLLDLFQVTPSYLSFAFLFIFTNMIRVILLVLMEYGVLKFKYSIQKSLTKELLENILSVNLIFFSDLGKGKLLNTLNKEMISIGDSSRYLASGFAAIFQIIIYLIIPFYLNFYLTLYTLLIVGFFALPIFFVSKLSHRIGALTTSTANKVTGNFNESLQAVKLIMGYGNRDYEVKKNILSLTDHIKYAIQTMLIRLIPGEIFKAFAILSVVISIGLTLKLENNLAENVAVFWSLYAVMPLISNLLKINVVLYNFLPSYEQFHNLMERAKTFKKENGKIKFEKINRGIFFKNVSFSYPGKKLILENLNFLIKKNKITSIIGHSGSGKSTISDLVLGLLDPVNGVISIDDKDLNIYDNESFRKRVGFVPQEPFLFYGSIKDNILWGNDQANEDDVCTALKLANAYDFVMKMSKKLDTIVGERGTEMSGGERQRIALARALIRKPELLILDEATSSLDLESENLINQSIKDVSLNSTILLIAHRSSSYKISDFVYELNNKSLKLI